MRGKKHHTPTKTEISNSFKEAAKYHKNVSFPSTADMMRDVVIGVLFNGSYEKRRVVITNDYIIFTEVDQQEIIDFIPIADIFSVDDLDGITSGSGVQENQNQANIASLETVASTLSAFQIRTVHMGYNCGRKYCLQAESDPQCEELITLLDKLAVAARRRKESKTAFQRSREAVLAIYVSTPFQMCSALLIFLNFFNSAVEAQLADEIDDDDGARTRIGQLIDMGNTILTSLFVLELGINLYAHWFCEFFSTWMNIWDAVIVMLSVASLGPLQLAMPVTILRFFRVVRILRVLKIFSRLPELKRIISALSHSLIPMLNAFLIVLVVMAIYSIVGVTYFRDQVWHSHRSEPYPPSTSHCLAVVRLRLRYFLFAEISEALDHSAPEECFPQWPPRTPQGWQGRPRLTSAPRPPRGRSFLAPSASRPAPGALVSGAPRPAPFLRGARFWRSAPRAPRRPCLPWHPHPPNHRRNLSNGASAALK